ncbi:MAG TPA: winged helix domain-containing protein, partial [Xanthomonadaceae bacterium]|nr:winged helix domain-containing protein [Xanthomonadaceae bacterium]
PDLSVPADGYEIDAAAIARARRALDALQVDDAAVAAWFGGFISAYRSAGIAAPPKPPTEASVRKAFASGGGLARHPFVRTAWTRHGDHALLFAGGVAYPMDMASARSLAAATTIDVSQFAELDADAQAAVIAMTLSGSYAVQRVPRGRRR